MSIPRRQPVRKRRRGGPRRGPMRDPKYLRFLRERGKCSACRVLPLDPYEYSGIYRGVFGCDPAHGPVNGTSSKGPDDGAIPLCRAHHDEQTWIGWPAFAAKYGFQREDEAKAWRAAFLIYQEHGQ